MPTFEEKLEKVRSNRDLSVFDVVSIDHLTDADIDLILELAMHFHELKTQKLSLLKNVTIINVFYEDSTRTRSSFELAGKHLGADTINISASASSVKKGESYLDTIHTLNALQAKTLVMRTSHSGIQEYLSKHTSCAILNAGDGWHEHPSQALLDARTILDHHKTMKGKTVTIVGDILHSRVFGSIARLFPRLGAKVRVACPGTFVPDEVEKVFKVKIYNDVETALKDTDVIYALRVQEERGASGDIPTLREYSKTFGMNPRRLALANKDAILMHPGPVIRDTDVGSDLVIHPQSRILEQVENGLAVRKALLWLTSDRRDGKKKENARI